MDWFKKHLETAIILGLILVSSEIIGEKLNELKKDMGLIKTLVKNIRPIELIQDQMRETNE